MRQIVTNKRLKTKNSHFKNCQPQKMVLWICGCLKEVAPYERWSLMEVQLYSKGMLRKLLKKRIIYNEPQRTYLRLSAPLWRVGKELLAVTKHHTNISVTRSILLLILHVFVDSSHLEIWALRDIKGVRARFVHSIFYFFYVIFKNRKKKKRKTKTYFRFSFICK